MPSLLETRVRPGDVISSDLFQAMLDKLAELEERVAELEGTGDDTAGAPRISSTIPATQQNVGRELELVGVNFAVPANTNQVTVGGRSVTQFLAGSTSTALRFLIPANVSVPPGGANVEIRVTNANGSHTILYRLLPEIAGPPAPTIGSVMNDDGSAPPLRIGELILIVGANFAENPAENQITFRVTTAGGTVTYPRSGESIEIDTNASSSTRIRCRLPRIEEAPPFAPIPVTLELRVGASAPAAQQVTVLLAS